MSLIKPSMSISLDETDLDLTSSTHSKDVDFVALTAEEIEAKLDAIEESDTFAIFIQAIYNDMLMHPERCLTHKDVFGDDFEELTKDVVLDDEEEL